jgi:hypothetical protein
VEDSFIVFNCGKYLLSQALPVGSCCARSFGWNIIDPERPEKVAGFEPLNLPVSDS